MAKSKENKKEATEYNNTIFSIYSKKENNLTKYEYFKNQKLFWRGIFSIENVQELKEIVNLHGANFLTTWLQFLIQTVAVLMAGHLSTQELDAVVLANTLINVGGYSIGMGVSTAADTFMSQSYGSKNKKRVGIYLQRTYLAMGMTLLVIYCLYLNTRYFLQLLGQDPEISELTAMYVFVFMPGLFFDFNFLILARYLQNQNIVYPPLLCAIGGNIFNVVIQFIVTKILEANYIYLAVCQSITLAVMWQSLLIYVFIRKSYKETWGGWSKEAFYNIGDFFKIAIPGLVLTLFASVSFEVGMIVGGLINAVQLGAHGICYQIETLPFALYLGLSISVTTRIGQHIGGGHIDKAKRTIRVSIWYMFFTATILVVLLFLLQTELPKLFTNLPDVQKVATNIMQVCSFYPYADGLSNIVYGVMKGAGEQFKGAVINVCVYLLVSIPLGVVMALKTSLQMVGFWLGYLGGYILQIILAFIIVYRLNWNELIKTALKRDTNFNETLSNPSEQDISVEIQNENVEFHIHVPTLTPFKPVLIKQIVIFSILIVLFLTSLINMLYQTPLYQNKAFKFNKWHSTA